MPLNTTFVLQIQAALTKAFDLATGTVPTNISKGPTTWATGTGADQADKVFHDERTLAASTGEDFDLAGSMVDAFGDAFTPARIKAIFVFALAANANNVNVTRPANGVPLFLASGDGIAVRPGGMFFWMAPDATGVAVTAGTGDLLHIENSGAGTSVTYDLLIIGASA